MMLFFGSVFAGTDVLPYNTFNGTFTAMDNAHVIALVFFLGILFPVSLSVGNRNTPDRIIKALSMMNQRAEDSLKTLGWVYNMVSVLSAAFVGLAFCFMFLTDAWYYAAPVTGTVYWGVVIAMIAWLVYFLLRMWWPMIVYNESLELPIPHSEYSGWYALPVMAGYVVHAASALLLLFLGIFFAICGGIFYSTGIRAVSNFVPTNTAFFFTALAMILVIFVADILIMIVNVSIHNQASVKSLMRMARS